MLAAFCVSGESSCAAYRTDAALYWRRSFLPRNSTRRRTALTLRSGVAASRARQWLLLPAGRPCAHGLHIIAQGVLMPAASHVVVLAITHAIIKRFSKTVKVLCAGCAAARSAVLVIRVIRILRSKHLTKFFLIKNLPINKL